MAVRLLPAHIFIQETKLIADILDILDKIRELQRKLQISAVTDSVHRFSQNRTSCRHPVYLGFLDRIAALMEHIWEKVRQESSFCVLYARYIRDQTQCRAIANGANHSVHANFFKIFSKRLCANPVVSQKHHCLSAVLVANVHKHLHQLCHLALLKFLEIAKFLGGHAVCIVVVSLINNVFWTERIADFLLKLL